MLDADALTAGVTVADCFTDASQLFQSAASAVGVIERRYSVAGRSLTLRFAGPALVEALSIALDRHSGGRGDRPELTVSIWDSTSTGIRLPPIPRDAFDGGTSGRSRVGAVPAIRAKYRADLHMLSMLHRRSNAAVFCIADPALLPYGETGSPLRSILNWWMADHDRWLVHAAAVGTASGGILIVGKSGSGKSSTALACLGSSLRYVADDYCLVGLDPEPTAHALYGSGKLDADHARRFAHLLGAPSNVDRLASEKAVFFVNCARPDCLQDSCPIRAIVVPVVTDTSESYLEPTSAATALRALAPSSIFQLPGAGREAFVVMTQLVRRVPSHVLRLGRNLEAVPDLLEPLAAGATTL